ncbi:MAG: PUR family DNA/RNA-binding protein [Bacteroidaceae bacterium]|nr:PUR family DNA/RNA-binding protein [Bacteroidaceae bacterium]
MDREKDIVYSEAVKAGKRIYYLDVKRNRRGELYLCITESKKITQGDGSEAPFTFEKHKIFLYEEDFGKFIDALSKAVSYIHEKQPEGLGYSTRTEMGETDIAELTPDEEAPLPDDLKIDIDFE